MQKFLIKASTDSNMNRIIICEGKKEKVDGRTYEVIKPQKYVVKNLEKDFQTKYGIISSRDLKKPDGSIVVSSTKTKFRIFDELFMDKYSELKKLPQTIPLKDIGLIIAETGVNKESTIVDAGLGSGALAISLGNICKKIVSYEIREDHIKNAEKNLMMVGLTNVEVKHANISEGISETEVDLITLDLPEPWTVIEHAIIALKVGGYLVNYSPSVPQMQDFVNKVNEVQGMVEVKTVELIERPWDVNGRRVRPKTTGIGHSGFLTFARKIGNQE